MKWLRQLIRRFLPRDRYHDQAEQVNIRGLRAELLHKHLQVIERRHNGR